MSDAPSPNPAEPSEPVRSIHSTSFPPLLRQLGISLLVSTYQAGKVIVVRADGDVLNTLCRNFESPMGMAERQGALVIGTRFHIWEYYNHVSVVPTMTPPGRFDACYLPHQALVTGDIQIHEMAWIGPELWLVNTRFSCLCTLDGQHSFVPRWRPPFISALAAEDRCHLNGLGVRDAQVRYVTCLGQTDTKSGWRANKASGGCLLEVPSGTVLADGLSMPHSPRWHQGRLWFLESGDGSLALVDEQTGRRQVIAHMPGFTRAAWPFSAASPSSACPRCVSRPSSAVFPSPSGYRTESAASGRSTWPRGRRWRFSNSRVECRRSSPSKCCRGCAFRS